MSGLAAYEVDAGHGPRRRSSSPTRRRRRGVAGRQTRESTAYKEARQASAFYCLHLTETMTPMMNAIVGRTVKTESASIWNLRPKLH
jgi:hypothetical protein